MEVRVTGTNDWQARRLHRAKLAGRIEEFYNRNHQQSGPDGGEFVEGPDGPGRQRDAGTEDLGKDGTNQPKPKADTGTAADGGKAKARGSVRNNASKTKAQVESALDAIDAVHGVPEGVEKILVRDSGPEVGENYAGGYAKGRGGKAGEIVVNGTGKNPELVVAHEFGHYLDDQIGISLAFKDEKSQVGKNLVDNIMKSSTVVSLIRHKDETKGDPTGAQHQRASYLAMQHEVFARAYAQYIAVRSGNAEMLASVKRTREVTGEISKLGQWPDADFEPIANSFDEFFKQQGLR